jgi:hypothetical protein
MIKSISFSVLFAFMLMLAFTASAQEKTVATEAAEIKKMFEAKQEVGSIFAYETAMFDELVQKHPKIGDRLNFQRNTRHSASKWPPPFRCPICPWIIP